MACDWAMGGPMMFGMLLFSILVIGAVVAAVVFLVRVLGGGERRDRGRALALLEERYARGEVDDEEFAHRREALVGRG